MNIHGGSAAFPTYLLRYLESSSVVLDCWSGKGTNAAGVDWWLMASVLTILEELLVYFFSGEVQNFLFCVILYQNSEEILED